MFKSVSWPVGTVVRGFHCKGGALGSNLVKGECTIGIESALTKFGGRITAIFGFLGECPPFLPIVSKVKMSL